MRIQASTRFDVGDHVRVEGSDDPTQTRPAKILGVRVTVRSQGHQTIEYVVEYPWIDGEFVISEYGLRLDYGKRL